MMLNSMAFIYNTPIEGEMISFGRNQMGKDISQISEFAFAFAALVFILLF